MQIETNEPATSDSHRTGRRARSSDLGATLRSPPQIAEISGAQIQRCGAPVEGSPPCRRRPSSLEPGIVSIESELGGPAALHDANDGEHDDSGARDDPGRDDDAGDDSTDRRTFAGVPTTTPPWRSTTDRIS